MFKATLKKAKITGTGFLVVSNHYFAIKEKN